MFDLEYYNEIIDYGKLKKELAERIQTQYKKPAINPKKINLYRDAYIQQLDLFDIKHTSDYRFWYNNYYNK